MELLKELIHIVGEHSYGALNEILPEASKARKLADAITSGGIQTDEEAMLLLYQDDNKKEEYLLLKDNLAGLLLECVFNLPVFDHDTRGKAGLREKKELMVAEKLLDQNVYHSAEKIVLDVKAHAEKFQMLDLQIECAKHLRTIYTLKGNPKEVELYNTILKKLNKFLQYEQVAVGFNDLLESKLKHAIGRYREIAIEAKHYSFQLREWQKETTSSLLRLYQYKIELIMYYHVNDVKEWGSTLSRITDWLHRYPVLNTKPLQLYINLEWARYMRCMANIPEATKYIGEALRQSDYSAFNKFDVQALSFDLKLKEKKYMQAGNILKEVKESSQFLLLEAPAQETWLLREAYLYFIFLSLDDKASMEIYTPAFAGGFSVASFNGLFKAISKDKKGYNFMLIIIKEVLMKYKTQQDAEGAVNRANNLLAYYQQHMKDSCEERSKSFIKRLAKAVKSNFSERVKPEVKTAELKATPQNFDVLELIPYGDLYDLVFSTAGLIKSG